MSVLLPLFVVCFIVLTELSYYLSNAELVESADNQAKAISGQAGMAIEKELEGKSIRLEELADNPVIHQGTNKQAIMAALGAVKSRTTGFDMVAYADTRGYAFDEKGTDMDRGSRDYFKAVMSTGKPYMTGPSISGTTGKLITVMAYPVKDAAGKVTGCVYGTISLAEISDLVGEFKYMKTGYVYVVDEGGITIGYKQLPEAVGKLDLTKSNEEQPLDQRLLDGFRQALDTNNVVSTYYKTRKGKESKAVFAPIQLTGRRWVAIAAAPQSEIEEASSHVLKAMVGVSIVTIIIAVIIIVIVANNLTRPIMALLDDCNVINSGDLRKDKVAVESSDEIGQLAVGFNNMWQTMRALLMSIREKAEHVASASEELTAAAHQSAEAANQVAGSITQIADGVTEQSHEADKANNVALGIAEKSTDIADKAKGMAGISESAVSKVSDGRSSISEVVSHMGTISDTAKTIETSINQLAKGSSEIQSIVDLISNIAGQTNLLALNAAIEAARAGEAGRGFAVVAEEDRKLAEESNQSTKKIADLVARNQVDMDKAVTAAHDGMESVENGMVAVKKADEVFDAISGSIDSLTNGVHSVADNIKEMADASDTMRSSMDSIKTVSTHNSDEAQTVSAATEEQSASMQEIASASRSLANLATDLQGAVEKFKL